MNFSYPEIEIDVTERFSNTLSWSARCTLMRTSGGLSLNCFRAEKQTEISLEH
jgi:hypothetical protein